MAQRDTDSPKNRAAELLDARLPAEHADHRAGAMGTILDALEAEADHPRAIDVYPEPVQAAIVSTWQELSGSNGHGGDPVANLTTESDRATIESVVLTLDDTSYDRRRAEIAEKTGLRVSTLDRMRKQAAPPDKEHRNLGAFLSEDEPAEAEQDGAVLLDDIVSVVRRFVVMSPPAAEATALWVALTYLVDSTYILPLLLIVSPTKRCGKSTLLDVLRRLCFRAITSSGMTASSLFRSIEKWHPTILLDEFDAWAKQNEEIRGVVNAGHTRATSTIFRTEERNGEFDVVPFDTWSAKAVAGIGKPASTIIDRSVAIHLSRKEAGETVERFTVLDAELDEEFAALRRRLRRWTADIAEEMKSHRPGIPELKSDRARDNWQPLLSIAELAGGHWPETARGAAHALTAEAETDTEVRTLILSDVERFFAEAETDRAFSSRIVEWLKQQDSSPWADWGKSEKGLTPAGLARLLKPFDIHPTDIRIGTENKKGYRRDMFDDAFARYLETDRDTATESDNSSHDNDLECRGSVAVAHWNRDTEENVTPPKRDSDESATPAQGYKSLSQNDLSGFDTVCHGVADENRDDANTPPSTDVESLKAKAEALKTRIDDGGEHELLPEYESLVEEIIDLEAER